MFDKLAATRAFSRDPRFNSRHEQVGFFQYNNNMYFTILANKFSKENNPSRSSCKASSINSTKKGTNLRVNFNNIGCNCYLK